MNSYGFQSDGTEKYLVEKYKHVENPVPGILRRILEARRANRKNEKKTENNEQGS